MSIHQSIAAGSGASPVGEPHSPAGSRSSYYPPDFKPAPGTSWIDLAAREPMLDAAINMICTRLALSFDSKAIWFAMPDRREWRQADTYSRINYIREWLIGECNAAMERSIAPVEFVNLGGTND